MLLQRDESVDEISRILQDYIIKKPNHPTSYVLLTTFLKNYCPEETADLIQTLKDLASKCPSDARVIQLSILLGDDGMYLNLRNIISFINSKFVFCIPELRSQFMMMANMVDYYEWKDNLRVWKRFSRVVRTFLR